MACEVALRGLRLSSCCLGSLSKRIAPIFRIAISYEIPERATTPASGLDFIVEKQLQLDERVANIRQLHGRTAF